MISKKYNLKMFISNDQPNVAYKFVPKPLQPSNLLKP